MSHQNINSEEFVQSVKDEVLNNNIYVFTPKGDVIELPRGATPLDFAYKIHTKVGETTVGAIVNNNIVPLNYELQDNDIVKINTNKSSTPSKEWINMVKSTATKNKIKQFFTKNDREIYIDRGKYALEKELRKRKLVFSEFFSDENVKKICDSIKVENLDEIYLAVGNGKATVSGVVNVIDKIQEVPAPKVVKVTSKNIDADIIVSGIDSIKVNLANCCNPVYGDEIIGYITKGNGITVHRMNCHNLSMLEDRTLEVNWNSNANKRYLTCLLVTTNDSENHMMDLMQSISLFTVNIDGIKTLSQGDKSIYEVDCYVTGLEQLEHVILGVEKLSYVEKVERAFR
ncbi:MAG: bifunctional (p)ppGpp synthetase/guanosine-3',5'-bis(diphosphate) 3'-pyrophosphohydrolase [Bacilli bacterium]|nr:bifunctional (p)ppGpp synthetase/guanosine-3',5'-bis(diphosphate) 3'-pyrophosphohydrolase [Bacilli bacterium]